MRESHERGAVLGAVYTVALGAAFAIGSRPWHSVDVPNTTVVMVVWSLPITILLTMLAGAASKHIARATPVFRYCTYAVMAGATMTVTTPFWSNYMSAALVPTIGYAIVFDRWLVRPHIRPPEPRRPFAVISRNPLLAALEKGAVIGASTAIAIAIDYAYLQGEHYRDCGLLRCPSFLDYSPTANQMFVAVAIHTICVGILWGILVGYIAHVTLDPIGRWVAVVAIALVGICIFGAAWPRLAEHGLGIGLVHTMLLLSWTRRPRPEYEFPIARPTARPRSTCSRGARSRGPRPMRSDTSRTTR